MFSFFISCRLSSVTLPFQGGNIAPFFHLNVRMKVTEVNREPLRSAPPVEETRKKQKTDRFQHHDENHHASFGSGSLACCVK